MSIVSLSNRIELENYILCSSVQLDGQVIVRLSVYSLCYFVYFFFSFDIIYREKGNGRTCFVVSESTFVRIWKLYIWKEFIDWLNVFPKPFSKIKMKRMKKKIMKSLGAQNDLLKQIFFFSFFLFWLLFDSISTIWITAHTSSNHSLIGKVREIDC